MNAEELWLSLKQAIEIASEEQIPRKKICFSKPFWCKELTIASQELRTGRKNYRFRSSGHNLKLLRDAQKAFRTLMQDKFNEYFKNTIDMLNDTRSKDFWNNTNEQMKAKTDSGVAPLFKNDKFHFESEDEAGILRETFFTGKHLEGLAFNEDHKVLVENHLPQLLQAKTVDTRETWFNSDFTLEELEHTLRNLKTSGKSLDNDAIHPKMIKFAGTRFKDCLVHIANRSLDEGYWPWMFSKVTFLRKRGKPDYTNPTGYRPITISSYCGKIVERLLGARLRGFFRTSKAIDAEQKGLQSHRSTVRLLYRLKICYQEVKRNKQKGAVISIDFEKAFDSVWTKGLLKKVPSVWSQR